MSYTCPSRVGWVRFIATTPKGKALQNVTLKAPDGTVVRTQSEPFNWWEDATLRHVRVGAYVTAPATYTIAFDGPPLAAGDPWTPVWPRASIKFTESGKTYTGALPAFADSLPAWFDGPLIKERLAVVVPKADAPHSLVQVLCDVSSYVDGSTRIVFGLTNAKDTVDQRRCELGGLTITVGDAIVWGPKDLTLYEGQYDITVGLAGGHLEANAHPDPELWFRSGVFLRKRGSVQNAVYPLTGFDMGLIGDMTYSVPMNQGAGRPELGPDTTKAQAEYGTWRSDNQRRQVILQGRTAGFWSGSLSGPDGLTTTVNPDSGNKSQVGYGQYYMLEGAHLLDLTTMPFLLDADPCYLRMMQRWPEEVLEQVYKAPCLTSSYCKDIDIDYSAHADGQICFLGSNWNAEPRGIGRVLRSLLRAAVFTPKADSAIKAPFLQIVQQNVARFDAYGRRPALGTFNPPFIEFDPSTSGSYGNVHDKDYSMSWWQSLEAAIGLYLAYLAGIPTDLSLLKRITFGYNTILLQAIDAGDGNYWARTHYPRLSKPNPAGGPRLMFNSWAEIKDANWGTAPAGGWDSNDNQGQPGADYYFCEYATLGRFYRWFNGPRWEVIEAFWADKLYAAPGRGHYAFSIMDTAEAPTTFPPPVDVPPVIVPLPTGKTLAVSVKTTQDQSNSDPSTLNFSTLVAVAASTPPVVVPPPTAPAQTRISVAELKNVVAGSTIPVDVIAWNVGLGKATNVVPDVSIEGATVLSADSPDYDAATGEWKVGTLESGQRKDLTLTVKVKE